MWNIIDLFSEYEMHGGIEKSMWTLVMLFKGEVVCLSSAGFAAIVACRKERATPLIIVKYDTDDDIDTSILMVAKQSLDDCKAVEEVITSLTSISM